MVLASPKAPVVIWGPPGTGKTVTLVEAISVLYFSSTWRNKLRVLVCCPSNHAADLITDRLRLQGITPRDLCRLNAPSRDLSEL